MPLSESVREILIELEFTGDFAAHELDQLAGMATPVQWESQATIFREGDREDVLYLLVEGRVGLDISVPQRGRVRVLTLSPGEVLGWSSVFYQKPKTARATALTATRALALDGARLRELSDTDPRFGLRLARKLLNVVSDRLKATRIQLIDMFAPQE